MRPTAPILLCVRGRVDDRGWCEAAHRAAAEISNCGRQVVIKEALPEQVNGQWSAIVGHGMEFAADILSAARANPDIPCALTDFVDLHETGSMANLCCIDWQWDEGAFLAGVMASQLSASGMVGVLGGTPCRTQHLAMVAFVNGARRERANVTVLTMQAGSFDDEDRGMRLAESMFDEGVDVLLHTADSTGRGAIRAAQRCGRTMIGFMNQDDLAHDCVAGFISTDVKGVVASLLEDITTDRFRPGVVKCGLASGKQKFDILRDIPQSMRYRIDEVASLIAKQELRIRGEDLR
jgi:basic membrane lipoprotein Med (substrate-binding protein (PBP1-ABC) superfamily)